MSKQFVIQSRTIDKDGQRVPIGNCSEIISELRKFNTMADVEGGNILWGPGIRIELPPNEESVQQMLLFVIEDEIAWLPIIRLAKHFDWTILDIETGRELQP